MARAEFKTKLGLAVAAARALGGVTVRLWPGRRLKLSPGGCAEPKR